MQVKICAATALGAILLQAATPVRAAEPYSISAILPLSGGAAFLGQGERKTLEVMEKTVNAEGGIKGRPVKFEFQDDQSSPQIGVQLANEVIAKKPAVMLGSSLVAVCRAMAPLMENGPVDYCLSPGIHPDKGYVFSGNISTLDDIDALLRFLRLKGLTRVAIMTSTDATGQDAENGIRSVLAKPENKSMQLVDSEHFNITDLSVAAQIENVKATHPQAFIAWSTGTPIATIFRDIEVAGLDIPISTTAGNMTHAQMKQYASMLPKVTYWASAQWVVQDPKLMASPEMAGPHTKFYKAFQAAGIPPDESYDLAWDPGYILIDALRKLGTNATAPQVQNYLEHLTNYAGLDGVYNFEKVPQRGLDVTATTITQWDPKTDAWVPVAKPTGIPIK